MNLGKSIFSQLTFFLPKKEFDKCVARYNGNKCIKSFRCWDQYLCMFFAQLTYRESLRDTTICLRAFGKKLYHMGIRGRVSKSTLADANDSRDWRIYRDFAHILIKQAQELYCDEKLDLDLEQTVYAIDASIITLCLSVFSWAKYTSKKAGVKLHTQIDLRGNIPIFIAITEAKRSDVDMLDMITFEADAIYIMDRGYIDFLRLFQITLAKAYFVIRAKRKMAYKRLYSKPVDKESGVRSDQTIKLTDKDSKKNYPDKLRRIRYYDADNKRYFIFLTNNFSLKAKTIADLYRNRWQIELFFKWIKQHLRIKAFFGTSDNSVKTQIWIAVSTYLLVLIVRKKLNIKKSPYNILQVLSIASGEKIPILSAFSYDNLRSQDGTPDNQLDLFNI